MRLVNRHWLFQRQQNFKIMLFLATSHHYCSEGDRREDMAPRLAQTQTSLASDIMRQSRVVVSPVSTMTVSVPSFDTAADGGHVQDDDDDPVHQAAAATCEKDDRTIFDVIYFPYNCLPWYYQQRVIFEIHAVRRKLQYLSEEPSIRYGGLLRPSLIPPEYRGSFSCTTCSRMLGNLPKKKVNSRYKRRRSTGNDGGRLERSFSRRASGILHSFKGANKTLDKVRVNTLSSVTRTMITKTSSNSHDCKSRNDNVNGRSIRRTTPTTQVTATSTFLKKHRSRWGRLFSASEKISSTKEGPVEWFVRGPGLKPRPLYCSMEMILFEQDTQSFCRQEIAYPYQPLACTSSFSYVNGVDPNSMICRRLAKTLEVRTTKVNNVTKRLLIWRY